MNGYTEVAALLIDRGATLDVASKVSSLIKDCSLFLYFVDIL